MVLGVNQGTMGDLAKDGVLYMHGQGPSESFSFCRDREIAWWAKTLAV